MGPDFSALETEAERQLAAGLRPSLQIAVDWRGERVYERAFGAGATVDSRYVLWSATKPLIAVAVLQLVESGALALDDRIAKHLPEFGAHGKERATLAHVLSHRGGFPDSTPELSRELARESWRWDDALAYVCGMAAAWEPGTDRGYHPRSAWFVLGELLQRSDDRPLRELLRARVLDKLGLDSADFSLGREREADPAPLEVTTNGARGAPPPAEADYWNDPRTQAAVIPGAGGIARARALAAFYRALLAGGLGANGRILRPETVRLATAPHVVGFRDRTFLRDIPWGLGFHLKHVLPALDDCGTRATPGTYGHAGHFLVSTGFADPGRDLAVAILSNGLAEPRAGSAGVTALADAIHAAIDGATGAARG